MGSKPWAGRFQAIRNAARRVRSTDFPPELEKDNDAMPETLGIGAFERRLPSGEIQVFLYGNNTIAHSPNVTLGKYAEAKPNGALFYLRKYLKGQGVFGAPEMEYFDHLLPAVCFIMDLQAEFDRALNKDQDDENVHN